MAELLEYLQNRRSALAMTLIEPAPDSEQVRQMIKIASRVPDHGKLAPWRFIEYLPESRVQKATTLEKISRELADHTRIESRQKQIDNFINAPLVIGVVSAPVDNSKVPEWEQVLSAGAATFQLLMAANALGYEAQWLSGFYMFDADASRLLGIEENEKLAGMVHIGSSNSVKSDRTRPDIEDIFTVV